MLSAPFCAAMFISAGEDGTVRQVDLRENCRSMTLIGKPVLALLGITTSCCPLRSVQACIPVLCFEACHCRSACTCHPTKTAGRCTRLRLPAADQRQEKTGLAKTRVPINSIALCPLHPHLFATGGGDAIGALLRSCICDHGLIAWTCDLLTRRIFWHQEESFMQISDILPQGLQV